MKDLIDRQDAIDALSYCQTYLFDSRDDDEKISLEDAEYAIEQLPSAQPETHDKHTETHACDLISRQAVIEALGKEPEVWTDSDAEIAERNQWRMDVAAIKAVPSAEPERKKGRWIDRDHMPNHARCSECGFFDEWAYEYNYCPNCGADMRGEQE